MPLCHVEIPTVKGKEIIICPQSTHAHTHTPTNLDGNTPRIRELKEMVAEFLHSTSQKLDISDPQQALNQGSGPVVYTHPGYNLHDRTHPAEVNVQDVGTMFTISALQQILLKNAHTF